MNTMKNDEKERCIEYHSRNMISLEELIEKLVIDCALVLTDLLFFSCVDQPQSDSHLDDIKNLMSVDM